MTKISAHFSGQKWVLPNYFLTFENYCFSKMRKSPKKVGICPKIFKKWAGLFPDKIGPNSSLAQKPKYFLLLVRNLKK